MVKHNQTICVGDEYLVWLIILWVWHYLSNKEPLKKIFILYAVFPASLGGFKKINVVF